MLIRDYTLDVSSPRCDPGAERWNAIAHLSDDISEALPYLNAILKGCIYDHPIKTITWQRGGRRIIIDPKEIAVTNLKDREDACAILESVVETINKVWGKRTEIEPSYKKRERLKALDIYKLLPGTNCRACGEPTCFTFALKLTAGEVKVKKCSLLFQEEYKEERVRLLELLQNAPSQYALDTRAN